MLDKWKWKKNNDKVELIFAGKNTQNYTKKNR